MRDARPLPRVLVATAPEAREWLSGILGACPVDFVCSIDDGVAALGRNPYSHVIVGYLFADSQMFEFARHARALKPSAQVLCVKAAGRPLRPEVRAGLDIAARELGCGGFYDLTAGQMPEAFNGAFDRMITHFHPEDVQGRDREKLNGAFRKLRAALHDLRTLA